MIKLLPLLPHLEMLSVVLHLIWQTKWRNILESAKLIVVKFFRKYEFHVIFVWLKPINVSRWREEDTLCDTCWKLSSAHIQVSLIRILSEILRSISGIYYLERSYLSTNLQSFCFSCVFFIRSLSQVNTSR